MGIIDEICKIIWPPKKQVIEPIKEKPSITRKRKTSKKYYEFIKLSTEKLTIRQLASKLNVSVSTIVNWRKRFKEESQNIMSEEGV